MRSVSYGILIPSYHFNETGTKLLLNLGLNGLVKITKQSSNTNRITCVDMSPVLTDSVRFDEGSNNEVNKDKEIEEDKDNEEKEKKIPIISYLLKTKLASESERLHQEVSDLIKQCVEQKKESSVDDTIGALEEAKK